MNERNNLTKQWLEKADHDLGGAKIIYLNLPEYFDIIAYHCQQAAEKYLKGVLYHLNINFPRTHNLIYLCDLLEQKIIIDEKLYDKAILLNGMSVQIRYPDNIIKMTKEELENAINIAQEFRDFALNIIEK